MVEISYRPALASAPFIPAADWASSLRVQVAPLSPHCRDCLRNTSSGQAINKASAGTVVFLPEESLVAQDSIVRLQDKVVNEGAYNHPGLALLESCCGHLVYVAAVTSFDGAGIQAKYTRIGQALKNDIFWRYLALGTHLLPPHNDLWALETAGDSIPKSSYVHLQHGYWIEKNYLLVQGAQRRKRTTVTRASLQYALWAYATAQEHRRISGITSEVKDQQQEQQQQTALRGRGQQPSTSLAFSPKMGVSQGALCVGQTSMIPYSVGKDQVSWRGTSSRTAVAQGNSGAASASWRRNHTANYTIPYAVCKSQTCWRRGS